MKNILTIIFLLTLTYAYSQTPTWEWAKSGTGNGEGGFGTVTDAAGDVYVTGVYLSSITFGPYTLTNADTGYMQIFLVKYDASGNVLWAKNSSGQIFLDANIISADSVGNVYLAGTYNGDSIAFGSTVLTSTGYKNIFILKYSPTGNIIWWKNIGSADAVCYDVASNNSGNVFITGVFYSPNLIFGLDTLILTGNQDVFIAKLDSAGNFAWARSSLSTNNDVAYGVATDALSNAYITGKFQSDTLVFGNDTLFNSGFTDCFLVKYDSSGNEAWAKSGKGTDEDWSWTVTTNPKGKIFITGYFTSADLVFGSDTLHCSPLQADVFTVQYDFDGNVDWASSSSGAGTAYGWDIAADADGNAYVTGSVQYDEISFDTIALPLLGNADPMFIVRYNSIGQATFATELTSGGDDQNSIAVDNAGDIYVAGDFLVDTFIVGVDTLIRTQGENPFVAKLRFSFGVGVIEYSHLPIPISPNPASSYINLIYSTEHNSTLTLTNAYGTTVKQLTLYPYLKNRIIYVDDLPEGIYLVTLKEANQLASKKLIIQR